MKGGHNSKRPLTCVKKTSQRFLARHLLGDRFDQRRLIEDAVRRPAIGQFSALGLRRTKCDTGKGRTWFGGG